MISVSTSLETKILETLRALKPGVQCVGLMEVADAGVQKEQDLSALQVYPPVLRFCTARVSGGELLPCFAIIAPSLLLISCM